MLWVILRQLQAQKQIYVFGHSEHQIDIDLYSLWVFYYPKQLYYPAEHLSGKSLHIFAVPETVQQKTYVILLGLVWKIEKIVQSNQIMQAAI